MKQIDCVLQEVIVKVFIQVQQEVKTDFLGVHDLLNGHIHFFNVSVNVLAFNNSGAIPSWDKEVDVASGIPVVCGYDFFSFIVDVVDRG